MSQHFSREIKVYRKARERDREIALACHKNPKLEEPFRQARKAGHSRSRAFEIAKASVWYAGLYRRMDRNTVRKALVFHNADRDAAANDLGISRKALETMMVEFCIC